MLQLAALCAAVLFGLLLAADKASASPQEGTPVIDQSQKASNDNETKQKADADVESKQKNLNVPLSLLELKSGNGEVEQSNKADNEAEATNHNGTVQGIAQSQEAEVEGDGKGGHKGGKPHGPCGCDGPAKRVDGGHEAPVIDQSQKASNDNETKQESDADVRSSQVNVNMPISVLSFGSNNGDVEQSNKAHNEAEATNGNVTGQGVHQSQKAEADGAGGGHDEPAIDQSQKARNGNETEQKADADVRSKQANVNMPISLLSLWSNNGDVEQSNKAHNEAEATNGNGTLQLIGQLQRAA
jgi:hypothetical protein